MNRIVVLATDEEKTRLLQLADGRPLSSWIKKQILGYPTVREQLEDMFGKDKLAQAEKAADQPGKRESNGSESENKGSDAAHVRRSRGLQLGRRRAGAARGPRPGNSHLHDAEDHRRNHSGNEPADATVVRPDLSATETYYHTASSDRRTCMCDSCVQWRKDNDIPYGGAKPKEKNDRRRR